MFVTRDGKGEPVTELFAERIAMKTTRREFLAAAAAAPLASPILLGMQDKAGSKAPVLGQGKFTLRSAA